MTESSPSRSRLGVLLCAVPHDGNTFAAMINWSQIMGDQVRVDKLKNAMRASGVEQTPRSMGLRSRQAESLAKARYNTLLFCSRIDKADAALALFEKMKDLEVAGPREYEAALWSIGSYERQLEFWFACPYPFAPEPIKPSLFASRRAPDGPTLGVPRLTRGRGA